MNNVHSPRLSENQIKVGFKRYPRLRLTVEIELVPEKIKNNEARLFKVPADVSTMNSKLQHVTCCLALPSADCALTKAVRYFRLHCCERNSR